MLVIFNIKIFIFTTKKILDSKKRPNFFSYKDEQVPSTTHCEGRSKRVNPALATILR